MRGDSGYTLATWREVMLRASSLEITINGMLRRELRLWLSAKLAVTPWHGGVSKGHSRLFICTQLF